MTDLKLLKFPVTVGGTPVSEPPQLPDRKYGVYPLGTTDLVMSAQLFELVLTTLERGSATERLLLVEQLRKASTACFVT